jgi:hypothetical protein
VCNTNNFLQYQNRATGQVPQPYVQRYSIQYHRVLFISESGLPAYYSIPLPEQVSTAAEANCALRKSNECRGPGEAKKKINERKVLNIHMQYSSRLYYMLTDISTSRTICAIAMHTVPDADPMHANNRRSYRKTLSRPATRSRQQNGQCTLHIVIYEYATSVKMCPRRNMDSTTLLRHMSGV